MKRVVIRGMRGKGSRGEGRGGGFCRGHEDASTANGAEGGSRASSRPFYDVDGRTVSVSLEVGKEEGSPRRRTNKYAGVISLETTYPPFATLWMIKLCRFFPLPDPRVSPPVRGCSFFVCCLLQQKLAGNVQ